MFIFSAANSPEGEEKVTDAQLAKMLPIGVEICVCTEGWRTTVVRWDPDTDTVHEESWPLRSKFRVALSDVRRCAPQFRFVGLASLLCRFGLFNFVRGERKESEFSFVAIAVEIVEMKVVK